MKRIVIFACVIFVLLFVSCDSSNEHTYTQEELQEAIADAEHIAYKRGYEEGYALAKHEDEGEFERIKSEYGDDAYAAGYEVGYEDGYCDGIEAN